MAVGAVIPNWNGLRFLTGLFESLSAQSRPPREIILVDGGSTDGSAEWAEAHGARVLRLGANPGFAVAVNRGVALANCEIVAVLNNDVRLSPDWLERLTETLAGGQARFAVGKLLSQADPRRIDGTYDAVCMGGTAWRCGQGREDGHLWSTPCEVQFPPFTAVVIQREAFVSAGGLDEVFESYLEDVDFGLRCASKRYTGRYVPEAIAWHAGSGTLGRWHPRTVRQIARNQLFLIARHYPASLLVRFGWRIAVAQVLWGLVAIRHGAGAAWLLGKLDGFRRFHSVRKPVAGGLEAVLSASEHEIQRLQEAGGTDWYWRLYFGLT